MIKHSYDVIKNLLNNAEKSDMPDNINGIISELYKEGFVCNDVQKDFLLEHMGQTFTYKNPRWETRTHTLTIDPLDAVDNIGRGYADEYEAYTQKKLCIVGQVPQQPLVLYLADDGTFYGCNDEFLINLGSSFEQCLYRLMNAVEIEVEEV